MYHRISPRKRVMAVGLFFVVAASCTPRSASNLARGTSPRGEVVTLERIPDPSPERWWGLTNIFFAAVPPSIRSAVRTGEGWSALELADVVSGEGIKPIYAARFKMPGSDQMHYVVDTAGDLDFTHARSLTFQRRIGVVVANFELEVRSTSGNHRRVPYQVLLSDDGYTYARIAEYRTGRVRVDGRDYALKLRSRSRNDPFYGANEGTVFLIDLDGDGQIAEQAAVTVGGRPVAAEQVMPHTPFLLGAHALEVTDLDSVGSRLVVRPSKTQVAAAVNFRAPELSAELLSGGGYQLSRQPGKVVLIEFWSTECAFSEKVRRAANDLAAAAGGTQYAWVAVARESDRVAIQQHLVEHPMSARVTLSDSAAWATYNPTGVTPLFVVVDQNGVIRFRAMGASAMDAVTAKVKELLDPAPPR